MSNTPRPAADTDVVGHYEVSWTVGAIHAPTPVDAARQAAELMRHHGRREVDEFEVYDVDARTGAVVDLAGGTVRPASSAPTRWCFGPRALELVQLNSDLSAGAVAALYAFAVLWDHTAQPVTTDDIARHAHLAPRTVHQHLTQWTPLRHTTAGWSPKP